MKIMRFRAALIALGLVTAGGSPRAQVVEVTLRLDTERVAVGEATTLHALAQVAPALRPNADRIFSWYVDLLALDAGVASADYSQLQKPVSDKDPRTSSSGSTDGANRRGIYDTFLNSAGAGVAEPVELFSVVVRGMAAGRARFAVQAGTGVGGLAADFIVAPKGGGGPWIGGNYSGAQIVLEVGEAAGVPALTIARSDAPGRLTISYPVQPGKNHILQYRDALEPGAQWLPFPGAPHNGGSVTITNNVGQRFFRLAVGDGTADSALTIAPSGAPGRLTISYPVQAGKNHVLQYRDALGSGAQWQPFPGAPHNSGSVTVTNDVGQRFFRLAVN
jgi:hypothetical protein